MSRCTTFTFQVSIISKWLAKHISTKVSFIFTIRKSHVYIDIGCPWIWNKYFYLGIWIDDRTKIIVLPSFQIVTQINSQSRYEIVFINVLWHINLYMNIGISNWHNWSFDTTIRRFYTLFQFLTRFLTSEYVKSFSTYFVRRNGAVWIRGFQLLKRRKKKINWNIKTKCITNVLLTDKSSRMKGYTCHYEVST